MKKSEVIKFIDNIDETLSWAEGAFEIVEDICPTWDVFSAYDKRRLADDFRLSAKIADTVSDWLIDNHDVQLFGELKSMRHRATAIKDWPRLKGFKRDYDGEYDDMAMAELVGWVCALISHISRCEKYGGYVANAVGSEPDAMQKGDAATAKGNRGESKAHNNKVKFDSRKPVMRAFLKKMEQCHKIKPDDKTPNLYVWGEWNAIKVTMAFRELYMAKGWGRLDVSKIRNAFFTDKSFGQGKANPVFNNEIKRFVQDFLGNETL